MAMSELVNRAWTFLRREWPLCLFVVGAMYDVLFYYDDVPRKIAGLIGLGGSLFCLKRFGLDHCPWIYALAAVLTLPTDISVEDANLLQAYKPLHNWEPLFIQLVFGSLKGMLASIPFSLFFLRKVQGFSAIWKIPLCIFFMLLALEPLFWGLPILIILPFVPCP